MISSVDTKEEILKKLRSNAKINNWTEVLETYKQERALRKAKITGTGDTVLHIAVSKGQEKVVANMVDLLILEENNVTQNNVVVMVDGDSQETWNMNVVLGAEDDEKNTPLHLAAIQGNVEMCKKIGGTDPSLIARRNIAGETPIFLAALYGKKEAFLWLHYMYMESPGVSSADFTHCVRNNDDTILHCAIAEDHIDVAIEIVHLYKDLVRGMRRNKEGLSPLHLLAAQRSAFKSTRLLELPILVRPIYRHDFQHSEGRWKVEEKNQATTLEELQKKNQVNVLVKFFKFMHWLLIFILLFLLLQYFVPENTGNILQQSAVLIMLLQALKLGLDIWLSEIRIMTEKHTWSLQMMNELLQHSSDEDMSQIILRSVSEQFSISLQREEFNGRRWTESEYERITIETPLMIAAKNGVVEIVEKILELFPSRIKDVNAEGKNIVLLAVECRQTEVFNFLRKHKWQTRSLFRQVDKDENNVLHLAARLEVDRDWLNPGEIGWFEFVKNSVPPYLLARYNVKMKTPVDIFGESRKELIKSEGEWVAKTSQACSVVSTLVLSVAFATRTNVPGGYDAKSGNAILRNNLVFEQFDGYSFGAFYCSLISTIFFLSIVVSRPQSIGSWTYVPLKLCIGMYFMFASIVYLSISFNSGDFFSSDEEDKKSYNTGNIVWSWMIVLFVVAQLPTFFGPTLSSLLRIPTTRRKVTCPIEYRRTKNEGDGTDLNHQN